MSATIPRDFPIIIDASAPIKMDAYGKISSFAIGNQWFSFNSEKSLTERKIVDFYLDPSSKLKKGEKELLELYKENLPFIIDNPDITLEKLKNNPFLEGLKKLNLHPETTLKQVGQYLFECIKNKTRIDSLMPKENAKFCLTSLNKFKNWIDSLDQPWKALAIVTTSIALLTITFILGALFGTIAGGVLGFISGGIPGALLGAGLGGLTFGILTSGCIGIILITCIFRTASLEDSSYQESSIFS